MQDRSVLLPTEVPFFFAQNKKFPFFYDSGLQNCRNYEDIMRSHNYNYEKPECNYSHYYHMLIDKYGEQL